MLTDSGICDAVARKKILLRILARQEAERLGLVLSEQDIQEVIDNFRFSYGLIEPNVTRKWLASIDVTEKAFLSAMYDLAIVKRLEEVYDAAINQEIRDHVRINSIEAGLPTKNSNASNLDSNNYWIQINVALERQNGNAIQSARALFKKLYPLITEKRRQKNIEQFYFLRKPPDLRLRFLIRGRDPSTMFQIRFVLSELKRNGLVKDFFSSIYEPEIFQFGGPEAMRLVHTYFDVDTEHWILLDSLAELSRRTISTETLLLAVMNDLFLRTLSCPSEVWDVWCNLSSLLPPSSRAISSHNKRILIHSVLLNLSKEESVILENYGLANEELSKGLCQLWNKGKLQCGIRAILPFIAMFNFNRHGLDGTRQAHLTKAMKHAWNPKLGLIGAEETNLGALNDYYSATE